MTDLAITVCYLVRAARDARQNGHDETSDAILEQAGVLAFDAIDEAQPPRRARAEFREARD